MDGRIIQGEIIEKNLDGVIVIRLKDGSKLWFYSSEILKIDRIKSPSPTYTVFKPVPRSNLQPMESDVLTYTLCPHTLDPGHSIIALQSSFGFSPFDDSKSGYIQNLEKFNSSFSYKLGLTASWDVGLNFNLLQTLNYVPGAVTTLKYSNSVISEIIKSPSKILEVPFAFEFQTKIALIENREGLLQAALHSSFGLRLYNGLFAAIGIPIQFKFSRELKLRFFIDFFFSSTSDLKSEVISDEPKVGYPEPSDYTTRSYKQIFYFRNQHTAQFRFNPSDIICLFSEYAGRVSNLRETLSNPPEAYSATINSGVQFTFSNLFQLAVAFKFGLFDEPEKIGGGLGVAVRF